jgi:hypothetical protein
MASLNSPTELAVLDQAFEVSWADVAAYDPFRDFGKDHELRFALRRKLFALASRGMRDPEAMRMEILATLTVCAERAASPELGCLAKSLSLATRTETMRGS